MTLFYLKYRGVSTLGTSRRICLISMLIFFLAFDSIFLFLLVPWANSGKRFGPPRDYGGVKSFIGSSLVADLRRQILVQKPDQDYKYIYWAELNDIHLEGADLTGSVLTRADLRRAHLQRAIMFSVNLNGANLSRANLGYVLMYNAILENSILETANLAGAHLEGANLRNSFPNQSNFHGANLAKADLEGAEFYRSNLEGANLREANLHETDFHSANLRRVVAQHADFAQANLEDAFLDEADLLHARNLTIEQLSKAKTLFKAKLAPEMKAKLQTAYPDLFKRPNEDARPRIKFDRIFPGYDKGPDWSKLLRR